MDLLTGYGSDASDEPGGSPAAAPPSAHPSAGGGLPTGFFDSLPAPSQSSAGPSSATARAGSGAAAGPSGLPSDFFGGAAPQASAKPRPAAPSNGAGPSLLGKLPAPKTGKSNVVSFRPPIDLSKLAAEDDDDYQPSKKLKPSSAGMSLSELLPAPKSESALGAGSGKRLDASSSGQRRGSGQSAAASQQQQQQAEYVAEAEPGVSYSNEAFKAGAMQQQQHYGGGGGGGIYGPAYPPSGGMADAATAYPGYGDTSAAAAAPADPYISNPYYNAQGSAAGGKSGGFDLLEVALAAEKQKARRQGRGEEAAMAGIKIKEVSQQQQLYMDPAKRAEAQGLNTAMGPGYAATLRKEAGEAPDRMAKRKHQISTLYHQSKLKEMELLERKGQGVKSKSETQAKYGWS